MKQYAINDYAVVAELYFHMYPSKADNYRTPKLPTTITRRIITDVQEELSNISEDELIKMLKPEFNKQTTTTTTNNDAEQIPGKLPIKSQVYYELSDISDDEEELLL